MSGVPMPSGGTGSCRAGRPHQTTCFRQEVNSHLRLMWTVSVMGRFFSCLAVHWTSSWVAGRLSVSTVVLENTEGGVEEIEESTVEEE